MPKQNIQAEEVAHFDAHAAHWWDLNGPFRTLHDINPLRLSFISKQTMFEGKSVLDVGCGGGILSESMAKQGAKVVGIDMSPNAIDIAKEHAAPQKLKLEYKLSTIEDLAKSSKKKFDVITCMEMLEHVPDPASILQACGKLLKADGHLFLSSINRNPKSYLFAILGAEYVLKLIPKNTHSYDQFIKPSELDEWLRLENISMKNMAGINYNPLTKRYTLNQNTDVNYLAHCTFER